MAEDTLQGAEDLRRTLERLVTKHGPKIGKKAAGAGARKIAAGIRQHILQPRVRKAVRSRNVKSRGGHVDLAKAGFNVGRKRRRRR